MLLAFEGFGFAARVVQRALVRRLEHKGADPV